MSRTCLAAWVVGCMLVSGEFAHAQADKCFVSNGVRIRYVERGTGEPVVLGHGFNGSLELGWIDTGVFAELAKNYRVIAFDQRGHGKSDKPRDTTAYGHQMALDIVRLMDHLEITRAHIVGYSMGANLVAKLLTLHPERFITATLGGESGRPPMTAAQLEEMEQNALEYEQEIPFRSTILRTWPTNEPPPTEAQLREASRERVGRGNDLLAFAAGIRAIPDEVVTPGQMAAVRVPVLGIAGSLDSRLAGLKRLQAILPNMRLVIIEGAVHATADPRSAPRRPEFLAAVRAFLAEHPLRTN